MSNLIPENEYTWEIVLQKTDEGEMSCVLGEASTGTKQVAIQARIIEGEYKGKVRTWLGYFTEDTLDSTLDQLRNAGFVGDDLSEFPFQRPEGTFRGRVTHEDDQKGRKRDRLRFINDPNRSGGFKMDKPMGADQRRLFAASLKDVLKNKPGRTTAPATNGAATKRVDI